MLSVFILIASIFSCLVIGGLVVSRGFKDAKIVIYGLLTIFMLLMIFSNSMSFNVNNNQIFYVRGVMFGATICVYLSYLLIGNLRQHKKFEPFYRDLFFYSTIVMAVLDWTDFLFPGVKAGSPPTPIYGLGIFLFFTHFVLGLTLAIRSLMIYIKSARSKNERLRYLFLIMGFIPTAILAPITGFILPNFGVTNFIVITPVYAVIFVIFVGYSIVRHGLFDVKRAVIRTTTYVLSLLTLSAIYYGVAYLLSIFIFKDNVSPTFSASPLNIALALLLAFVFQPIRKFFDKYTNKFFYKENYNTDDFFAKINKTLSITTDLRNMLERAAADIGSTLKNELAFFFVYTNDGHYVCAGSGRHRQLPKDDADTVLSQKKFENGVLMASLLPEDDPVRRLMASHRIELILPLFQSNKPIGCLCLGEHLTSGYTNRDIRVLNTLSNELIIAIRNALAVQEIREFNVTLQQKIAVATRELRTSNAMLKRLDKAKDEFVSMASHQLRTPLTSVKGYISMVLEGDAGKISESQQQLLNEAFNSSERMVNLINDFLNVSRIQTGKFVIDKHAVDLSKLVEQEVNVVKPNAAIRCQKISYNKPKFFPIIDVDEGKIRQVVMNFIDNAIYYSHENSVIEINLSTSNNSVAFTVKDNGIGVPKSEQQELFTKFFRAGNARTQRPDGTGVGLYLAKKIILAHEGRIIFETVEGKGSTFGFDLPLSKRQ